MRLLCSTYNHPKRSVCLLLLVFLFVTNPFVVSSQDFEIEFDTVYVKEGEDLLINNKVYKVKKDTLFYIPSNVSYQIKRYTIGDDKPFYDTLKYKAANGNWFSHMVNDLLVKHEKGHPKGLVNPDDLSEFFMHKDKRINDIKIIRLNPFGTSVNDQKSEVDNWFEKAGNKLHFRTTERVIKKHLLFRENQKIDPYTLNDSERLLRNLSNIKDARILIQPVPGDDESVNVVVITRDVWSKAFGISTQNFSDGQFDFWDRNIFGLGHENKNGIFWDSEKTPILGYKGEYNLKNLGGSFIDWRSNYWDLFGTKVYRTEIFREFFTPDILYAGGITLDKSRFQRNIWTRDSIFEDERYDYSNADAWFGRSFPIMRFSRFQKSRSNIIIAGRIQYENFTTRPMEVNPSYLYRFHDKTRIFMSIGVNRQKFKRNNLIYSFGRTEDIPFGYLFNVTGGYEFGEFYDRSYLSLSMSHAVDMPQDNYLYGAFSIGGFFRDQNVEQGILNIESTYFTRLFRLRGFRFRYFLNLNYTNGINAIADEFATISNGEGITGLRSSKLVGTRKLVLNTELVSFSPIYIFGFRLVLYGFGDFGLIGNHNTPLFDQKLYSGYGIGLRLRNERLTFNTIQLRLAVYPNIPPGATPELFQFSGEPRLRPSDFFINKPSILTF